MSGLSFDNYLRNQFLEANGVAVPKATSTGTTIVGCRFDGGVVIAADTRATAGPIVADKNCEKLHQISSNVGVLALELLPTLKWSLNSFRPTLSFMHSTLVVRLA